MSPTGVDRASAASSARLLRLGGLAATLAAFGAYSVCLGQDVNWDQRNYHLYNVYALLGGRLSYDLLPAGIQTFLPQLYNVPFYFMARHWPPMLTGFTLGAVQGLNAVLAYAIARCVVPRDARHGTALAVLAAAVGVWSPAAMSELGTTFGDNLTSIFVLASLLCLVRRQDALTRRSTVLWSGALSGIAAGLKYTNAVYSVALLAAVTFLLALRRAPLMALAHLAAGMAVGAVLADGVWAARLWSLYRNPVFPFFNGLFGSPYWVADTSFADTRWLPTGVWDGLAYPFYVAQTQAHTMEPEFRDIRWAVLASIGLACVGRSIVTRLWRGRAASAPRAPSTSAAMLIAVFGTVAFLVWDFTFGYQRYLVPLELTSGVLLLVAVTYLCHGERGRLATVVLLSVSIAGAVRIPSWGRLPWDREWFAVRMDGTVPPNSMVLLMHRVALGYVIPFFPADTRFVKMEIWGHGQGFGPLLARDVENAVRSHEGPMQLLARGEVSEHDREVLGRYGLEPTAPCMHVESRLDPILVLCAVHRTQPGAAADGDRRTPS